MSGESKVANFDSVVFCNQDVGRLEIAMDDRDGCSVVQVMHALMSLKVSQITNKFEGSMRKQLTKLQACSAGERN